MTVKAALPYALKPPKEGTINALKRPKSVHRIDKPTTGLLIVAKTLPAMDHLTRQFRERHVKKTYAAIINGIPQQNSDNFITSKLAYEMGFHVDPSSKDMYCLIDSPLEQKPAVSIMRVRQSVKSTLARDGVFTLVEVKILTGRHHQVRRHMVKLFCLCVLSALLLSFVLPILLLTNHCYAGKRCLILILFQAWEMNRALVGDKEYDKQHKEAVKLRDLGLFLCSSQVQLEHPYYNTRPGRIEWQRLGENDKKFAGGKLFEEKGKVMISASIELPEKFVNILEQQQHFVFG